VVVLGSTAEAVALTRDERKQVGPAFSSRLGPERIFFLLVTKTNLC
jgi:dihydrodipicolinate synthase/N-acetylneuraminate lyase